MPDALEALIATVAEETGAATEIEARLARRLAIALWKGERAERIETALFDAAPKLRPPQAGFQWEEADPLTTFDLKRFNAVRGYQAQQGREISRCLKELRLLRKEALATCTDEPEAASENEPKSPPAPANDMGLLAVEAVEAAGAAGSRNEPDAQGSDRGRGMAPETVRAAGPLRDAAACDGRSGHRPAPAPVRAMRPSGWTSLHISAKAGKPLRQTDLCRRMGSCSRPPWPPLPCSWRWPCGAPCATGRPSARSGGSTSWWAPICRCCGASSASWSASTIMAWSTAAAGSRRSATSSTGWCSRPWPSRSARHVEEGLGAIQGAAGGVVEAGRAGCRPPRRGSSGSAPASEFELFCAEPSWSAAAGG